MVGIYVNSIKNDPENQCYYVIDYMIKRDNNLLDQVVLHCAEPARPELDVAISAMPEYFCQLAEMRPHCVGMDKKDRILMRRVKFLKASRAKTKNGLRYSLSVKVYNSLIGKYVTISLTGIPEGALFSKDPFEALFAEAEQYVAGHRGQESLFKEEETEKPKVVSLNQAS